MKIKRYADKIIPLMREHHIITTEDEKDIADYLNNTFGGEEYA